MSLSVRNQTSGALERVAGFNDTDSILSPSSKNPISNKAVYNALLQKIDKTVTDLINYYDKSQVYTKPEVRALIGSINTLTIEVVAQLPTSEISTTTIYFVGPAPGTNNYDEYVYVGGNWVQIGDTTIDLSNYVTSANLTTVLQDYYTKSQADALFNDYYDKDAVDDLLDTKQNTLDFDNTPIAGSQNPVTSAGIKTALDNILISGNGGSIIKVHHLAGAAAQGNTVTASKGSYSVSSTFDASGDAIIIGFGEIGNVTITATNGSETGVTTINIPCFSNYSTEITYGLDYVSWLNEANINPSYYYSLSEVLADEEAVRKLMTIHDSVDYLATVDNATDELVTTIINNDIAAKWISLRDYAIETLSANTYIKSMMDSAGKYGYGEWILQGQVPTLSANNSPAPGTVLYSSDYGASQNAPYYAFNRYEQNEVGGGNDQRWFPTGTQVGQYLGYTFPNPIKITRVRLRHCAYAFSSVKFIIQGNTGSGWIDLTEEISANTNNDTFYKDQIIDFENNTAYTSYRVYYTTSIYASGSSAYCVQTLQFYGFSPKNVIPIMTSNTAPYGTATASSIRSDGYQPYTAFCENTSYMYCPTGASSSHWFSYQFMNPVCVRRMYFYAAPSTVHSGTMKLQGSNDGSTWEDIHSWSEFSSTPYGATMEVNNDEYYLYYRVYGYMTNTGGGYRLKLYGHELKVCVPAMSNNTTPYGTAFASSVYDSSYVEYLAFTGVEDSHGWNCARVQYGKTDTEYVGYDFRKPVSIRGVYYVFRKDGILASKEARIIARNSTTEAWTVVSDVVTDTKGKGYIKVTNPNPFRYYAIRGSFIVSGDLRYFQVYLMNFYGVDLSERDWDANKPMKYCYDHGVEPNGELNGFADASKRGINEITVACGASPSAKYGIIYSPTVNFTEYNLVKCIAGSNFYNPSSSAAVQVQVQTGTTAYNDGRLALQSFTSGNKNVPNTLYLNVSSINQNAYPTLVSNTNCSADITEWWLE